VAQLMEFRGATLPDYAALYPGRPRRAWRFAALQILSGSAWTLVDDAGKPLALCGLYLLQPGILEAWLMLGPCVPMSGVRRILARAAEILPEHIIVARVDESNRAGKRLALLAGFVPIDEMLEGRRTWVRPALLPRAPVSAALPPGAPAGPSDGLAACTAGADQDHA